jgi:hypothetical protein
MPKKDRIDLVHNYYDNERPRLAWYLADEDGEMGAVLGDVTHGEWTLARVAQQATSDAWEFGMAEYTAGRTEGMKRDRLGYYWDTVTQARKALKVVRAALKRGFQAPWPSWATIAQSNGWTPPKGWKP